MTDYQQYQGYWYNNTSPPAETRRNPDIPNYSQCPPAPISPPPTRERFSYSRYQLELMHGIYTKVKYPNSMQKQLIAKRIGITRDQVKIWFQNKRRKEVINNQKPAAEKDGVDENALQRHLVPDNVMNGVLAELLSYAHNDLPTKSKKSKSKSKENRQKPYTTGRLVANPPGGHHDNNTSPPLYYPMPHNMAAASSENAPNTVVPPGGMYYHAASPPTLNSSGCTDASSPESIGSRGSPESLLLLPNFNSADTSYPPNISVSPTSYPPNISVSPDQGHARFQALLNTDIPRPGSGAMLRTGRAAHQRLPVSIVPRVSPPEGISGFSTADVLGHSSLQIADTLVKQEFDTHAPGRFFTAGSVSGSTYGHPDAFSTAIKNHSLYQPPYQPFTASNATYRPVY